MFKCFFFRYGFCAVVDKQKKNINRLLVGGNIYKFIINLLQSFPFLYSQWICWRLLLKQEHLFSNEKQVFVFDVDWYRKIFLVGKKEKTPGQLSNFLHLNFLEIWQT